MLIPNQNLTPDEKHHLKWLFIGAFVASGVTAACEIAKTDLQGFLQRRREEKKTEGAK